MSELPSILFMCMNGLESFVMPIVRRLSDKTKVKCVLVGPKGWEDQMFDQGQYDVLWIEWANELAVSLTNTDTPIMNGKKVVMRCHSYEVLSGLFQNVDLKRLDAVIFVAEHVKKVAMQISAIKADPGITDKIKIWTIPNGIDMERFVLHPGKKAGKEIAFVGNISHKKGFQFLLHAFRMLPIDYHLHIAGEFQDYRFKFYADHLLNECGDIKNRVTFHGKVDDIPRFLSDKHFIVSSSPWEGHPVNIIEGMAMGLQPAVHNFLGAEEMYPKEWVWTTIEDFVSIITTSHWIPDAKRNYVEKSGWTLDSQMTSIEEMFESLGPFEKETVSIDTESEPDPVEVEMDVDDVMTGTHEKRKMELPVELTPFEKALKWVEENTAIDDDGSAMIVARRKTPETIYPEVTGYLIPTLIGCDRKGFAVGYANWLTRNQNQDGGFPGPGGGESIVFDTAQALRGLFWAYQMNLASEMKNCRMSIEKAVSFLDGELMENGFIEKNPASYTMPEARMTPQAVNLYSMVPFIKAAELTGQWTAKMEEKVKKATGEYVTQDISFSNRNMLSHFFFYCIDAMIELEENCSWAVGFKDVAKGIIMKEPQFLPRTPFLIPAFSDVSWICTPGQAQAAICFFKLGMMKHFEMAMDGMRMLQEASGGFLGSYGVGNWYFPTFEPSWAVKFFLDACLIEKSMEVKDG